MALLLFAACSNTTSSDDDDDDLYAEEDSSSSVSVSSDDSSSSSSADSTETSSSSATNKSLASPSSLSYTQLSTTQWILTWSYTQEEKAPEDGFIVQYLDLETSEWIEVGRSNAEVYHYLLSGEEFGGYYYRVCAYDDEGTSSWTSEVWISAATTTATEETEVGLATPTSLSYSQMSSTSWMLTWSYTQDEVAETGFIIQQLDIDASEWVEVGRSNAEVYHYLLDGEEYSGYYYRVCAYNDDGNSSWSSEVYITATTTSDDVATLASPTSLSASQNSTTSWTLTWSYSQEEDAPESGFIIQQLGLSTGEWVEVGRSNAEVYHYLLNGEEYSGYYYRVAAYDDSDTSDWSDEVYIEATTTSEDEAVLASPSSLSYVQLSTTRWILTWGYTQEENAPESGFIVQQLNLSTSTWTEVGRASAEVLHYLLSGENYAGYYYRVCAYDEDGETSDWSDEVYVEATTTATAPGLASPTSLTSEVYVTDQSWVLTWEYTQNEDYPETGFIIQMLDWDEGDWVEIARTVTGVYHYLLNDPTYAGYYYRVCAYNDDGNSIWSEETFIGTIE